MTTVLQSWKNFNNSSNNLEKQTGKLSRKPPQIKILCRSSNFSLPFSRMKEIGTIPCLQSQTALLNHKFRSLQIAPFQTVERTAVKTGITSIQHNMCIFMQTKSVLISMVTHKQLARIKRMEDKTIWSQTQHRALERNKMVIHLVSNSYSKRLRRLVKILRLKNCSKMYSVFKHSETMKK